MAPKSEAVKALDSAIETLIQVRQDFQMADDAEEAAEGYEATEPREHCLSEAKRHRQRGLTRMTEFSSHLIDLWAKQGQA